MSHDYDLVVFAQQLSAWLHRDQTDLSGHPYAEHPYRVYLSVMRDGAPVEWQVAALLHDTTEDTAIDSTVLQRLDFPQESVEIVRLLDRNASESSYDLSAYWDEYNRNYHPEEETDYCEGANSAEEYYYMQIRKNSGALAVKLADIADNMLEWRLESLPEKKQKRLREKYARGLELLNANDS